MIVKDVLQFVSSQPDDVIDWALLMFHYKLMRGEQ